MKDSIFFRCWLGFTLLSIAGCAPQALYFHESTKVGFSADYTASDSEPLSTHFGYKRRIVAVVPTKNRKSPTGNEADAVNKGEALSSISKFYVKVDPSNELVIRNNFATGNAAKILLSGTISGAVAVAELMHGTPITISSAAAERSAAIKSKILNNQ